MTYLHVGFSVGEDGGLDVVPAWEASVTGLATQLDGCALLLATLNVAQDLFILHLTVLGTLVSGWIKIIANLEFRHALGEALDKVIIDVFVNIYAGSSMASLAKVHVNAPGGPLDCLVEIGISKNNVLRSGAT